MSYFNFMPVSEGSVPHPTHDPSAVGPPPAASGPCHIKSHVILQDMEAVISRRFISFAHSRHPVTFPFVTQSRESPGPMYPVSRPPILRSLCGCEKINISSNNLLSNSARAPMGGVEREIQADWLMESEHQGRGAGIQREWCYNRD